MIILDESESLLAHFDEKTMEKKSIEIRRFFHYLLNRCSKVLMMDGGVSERTLSFAKNYSDLTYVNNKNAKGSKVINLILSEDQWKEQLRADLTGCYQEEPLEGLHREPKLTQDLRSSRGDQGATAPLDR